MSIRRSGGLLSKPWATCGPQPTSFMFPDVLIVCRAPWELVIPAGTGSAGRAALGEGSWI
ncbi:hypothetical protein [Streptomyces clavifer]|uniref:hypothetical protein n=1 Tax=Streptomyces clavifer TaxID=68188 RepID=UPI002380D8D4|nr:hypothetical protein [Streptomyces clavifer]